MKKPRRHIDPRSSDPTLISTDKLSEVRGGALNVYLNLPGDTQGEIKGDATQPSPPPPPPPPSQA